MIPNNNTKELIIDNKEFIDAVDRVSNFRQIELEPLNLYLVINY